MLHVCTLVTLMLGNNYPKISVLSEIVVTLNCMKNLVEYCVLTCVAALLAGCSAALYNSPTYSSDDMYGTHDQQKIAQSKEAERSAADQRRKEREVEWARILGYSTPSATPTIAILNVEDYQTPYGQKLLALASDEYQRPRSYYELAYQAEVLDELVDYDPAYYTAAVDELGRVTISPRYASSMYGVWIAPYHNYAWNYGYPHRGRYPHQGWRYYSIWGYPSSAIWSFDYGINFGYSTFYDPWWGYSPYWYGGGWGWYMPYRTLLPPPPKRVVIKSVKPGVAAPSVVRSPDGTSVGRGSKSTPITPTITRPVRTPSMPTMPSSPARRNTLGR